MKFRLIPQEHRFYDLFQRQGQLVRETLSELSKSLYEGRSRHPRLRDLEHDCDDVTHEIYLLVNRTFVTPIDQGDILLLASALDEIVDLAEETSDKIELYRVGQITSSAKEIGECLAKAGDQIDQALRKLEGFRDLQEHQLAIHELENEGDRITREALSKLFGEDGLSAAELLKWKDIYDLLENTMDQCEQVANRLERISIQNA